VSRFKKYLNWLTMVNCHLGGMRAIIRCLKSNHQRWVQLPKECIILHCTHTIYIYIIFYKYTLLFFFLASSLMTGVFTFLCGEVGCLGFESQPLHILCIVPTNCVCSAYEDNTLHVLLCGFKNNHLLRKKNNHIILHWVHFFYMA